MGTARWSGVARGAAGALHRGGRQAPVDGVRNRAAGVPGDGQCGGAGRCVGGVGRLGAVPVADARADGGGDRSGVEQEPAAEDDGPRAVAVAVAAADRWAVAGDDRWAVALDDRRAAAVGDRWAVAAAD